MTHQNSRIPSSPSSTSSTSTIRVVLALAVILQWTPSTSMAAICDSHGSQYRTAATTDQLSRAAHRLRVTRRMDRALRIAHLGASMSLAGGVGAIYGMTAGGVGGVFLSSVTGGAAIVPAAAIGAGIGAGAGALVGAASAFATVPATQLAVRSSKSYDADPLDLVSSVESALRSKILSTEHHAALTWYACEDFSHTKDLGFESVAHLGRWVEGALAFSESFGSSDGKFGEFIRKRAFESHLASVTSMLPPGAGLMGSAMIWGSLQYLDHAYGID